MSLPRAPWWMYVVAASFLAFFCFTIYADIVNVGWSGEIAVDDTRGNLHLIRIQPGFALAKAGLRDGDRILAVNGGPIRTLNNWQRARMRFQSDQTVDLEVERDGTRFHAPLVPEGRTLVLGFNVDSVDYVGWRGAMLTWLIISCVVFLRPADLSARLGSLVFATLPVLITIAASYNRADAGLVAAWRRLPWPLALLLAVPALSSVAFPLTQLLFFAVFPRVDSSSSRRLLAWSTPGLLLAPAVFHISWPMYEPPAFVREWERPLALAWAALLAGYVLAAFGMLAANYRRLVDQNERRRVRAVIPALAIVLILIVKGAFTQFWDTWFGTMPPFFLSRTPLARAFDGVMFALFPLPIAYAILRHRFFDISFVVRRGLQYALARRVLVSMLPALGLLLLLDVSLHRDQTIGGVVSQRGWLYAVVGAAALVARQKQQQWLDALDRRFFRERYNAERLLRETAEEIRVAPSLEHVAPRVVARIEASLHPEFAALLVRGPEETAYHTLASAPAGLSPPLMPADSKLVGLLRLLGKPLQVLTSESGWLKQQLPHADTEFLRQAHIDLLVPVSLSAVGREALLVLGQKRSEEPYGTEDLELLLAIANGLGLLLERPASATASSGLEECPRCGGCYDSGIGLCREDGTKLTPSAVPRVLAGRYRLDRRLGRGGMGTVYCALDTSLDRQVALKLIREDLIASPEAAERFRREAKAAAAITHPNLVTLHDFAVDADHRAFLVMELLSGMTLRQHLRNQGRVPPERMLEMLRGVCSALTVIHQRGLIHRDLKPENIFLVSGDPRDVPKLLDFGLAKFVGSTDAETHATLDTRPGIVVGTPQYLSPEQLQGHAVSATWDLWALAIITYEMLSGVHPFGPRASVATLHQAILAGQFTPIDRHGPMAPEWQAFFVRGLSADAARRPGSAGAFLAECEQVARIGVG